MAKSEHHAATPQFRSLREAYKIAECTRESLFDISFYVSSWAHSQRRGLDDRQWHAIEHLAGLDANLEAWEYWIRPFGVHGAPEPVAETSSHYCALMVVGATAGLTLKGYLATGYIARSNDPEQNVEFLSSLFPPVSKLFFCRQALIKEHDRVALALDLPVLDSPIHKGPRVSEGLGAADAETVLRLPDHHFQDEDGRWLTPKILLSRHHIPDSGLCDWRTKGCAFLRGRVLWARKQPSIGWVYHRLDVHEISTAKDHERDDA